jgi:hypothetical protein
MIKIKTYLHKKIMKKNPQSYIFHIVFQMMKEILSMQGMRYSTFYILARKKR